MHKKRCKKSTRKTNQFILLNLTACIIIMLSMQIQPVYTALATTEYHPEAEIQAVSKTITKPDIIHITSANTIATPSAIMPKPAIRPKFKTIKPMVYYTTCSLNVRTKPEIKDDNIIKILYPYQKITVTGKSTGWYKIKINNKTGYVSSKYMTPESKTSISVIQVPVYDNNFKSWMPYTAITNKQSKQYKIQQNSVTGNYGIRKFNHRYCVALGTYFNMPVGTYFDLVLANNTTIPCVMADIKSNMHTKVNRIQTSHDGSMVEFIIDKPYLNKQAKLTGNISNCCLEWNSRIVQIIKYD